MNNINPKEDLASIRDMMEKSSKFSNLSGISIFFTGLLTIIAASLIYFDLGFSYSDIEISYSQLIKNEGNQEDLEKKIRLLIIFAGIVLTISLLVLYVTASRKTSKEGITLFNPTFKRALKSLFIPILSGGIFSFFLIHHQMYGLVAPATLIFYGLGLISASKYSYDELELLGFVELFLGIASSYFMGEGLLFWVIGFGLAHIIFGLYLYLKFDKSK
tara:strand:- start:458 stop:1108 length:651 start_codon:yes stop_codon:yes gene_type:complete